MLTLPLKNQKLSEISTLEANHICEKKKHLSSLVLSFFVFIGVKREMWKRRWFCRFRQYNGKAWCISRSWFGPSFWKFDRKRAMSCHLRTLATSIPQVLTKMRTTTIFAENNVYGNINNSTKEVKSFFSWCSHFRRGSRLSSTNCYLLHIH